MIIEAPIRTLAASFAQPLEGIAQESELVSPEERKKQLFHKAEEIIRRCGSEDDSGSGIKGTDILIIPAGEARVSLQLLQNASDTDGYILRTEVLPSKIGGENRVLDISITETAIQWGTEEISPEQLDTASALLLHLEGRISPNMSAADRYQLQQDMSVGMYRWILGLDSGRYGP